MKGDAQKSEETAQDKARDTAKPGNSGAAAGRYTIRHDPNTKWTAKGTIWTPAKTSTGDDRTGSGAKDAAKMPAKREIYVGKFLHDKAQENLGVKGVDMASVSAQVLGMATSGASRDEAKAWLDRLVLAKAPEGLQARLRIILGRAVNRTWSSEKKASAWYRMTAGYSPDEAREKLLATVQQLSEVAQNGRVVLGQSLAADAIEHWLNGSGRPWRVRLDWLRQREPFQVAEARVTTHYKKWLLTGKSKPRIERFVPRIANMKVGAEFYVPAKWQGKPNKDGVSLLGKSIRSNADFEAATGGGLITGKSPGLKFNKISGDVRHGIIEVTGSVSFEWFENYDWDEGKVTPVPSIDRTLPFKRPLGRGAPHIDIVHQDDVRRLHRYTNAKNFRMHARWQKRLVARLTIVDNKVVNVAFRWIAPKKVKTQ